MSPRFRQLLKNLRARRKEPTFILVVVALGFSALAFAIAGKNIEAGALVALELGFLWIVAHFGDDNDEPQHPVPGWDNPWRTVQRDKDAGLLMPLLLPQPAPVSM